MGSRITGTVREGAAPATPPSFTSTSPALAEVIREINKLQQQRDGAAALPHAGAGAQWQGHAEAAREVLRRWLAERLGRQGAEGVVIDNGSRRLSRETRCRYSAARALAAVGLGQRGDAQS